MNVRPIIALLLGIILFIGIGLSLGLSAVYCDQHFPDNNIPLICADTDPSISSSAKVLIIIGEWVGLFVLPVLIVILYMRFGWPRTRPDVPDSDK